ncbi:MAG: hypothetical protein O2822_07985, partial [Chloroflexi bacterium]|nr:hypothetical protein [Chloroflexota bacterium]
KMTCPVIVGMAGAEGARLRTAYQDRSGPADVPALRALVEAADARAVTEAMAMAEERAALESLRSAGVDETAMRLCASFARILVGRES